MKLKDAIDLKQGLELEVCAINTVQGRFKDKYDHELMSAIKILQIMKVRAENEIAEIDRQIEGIDLNIDINHNKINKEPCSEYAGEYC